MRDLDGKIALVVGGSRGLGLGIVRALAAEGAAVSTLARDAELAQHAASTRSDSLAEVKDTPVGHNTCVLRLIEGIQHIRFEFEILSFRYCESFHKRKIKVVQPEPPYRRP